MKITIEESDKKIAEKLLRCDEAFSLLYDIDSRCRMILINEEPDEKLEKVLKEIQTMINKNAILRLLQ